MVHYDVFRMFFQMAYVECATDLVDDAVLIYSHHLLRQIQ